MTRNNEEARRLPGELWGLVSYFNPGGGELRIANYRRFAAGVRGQGLPLLCVELALHGNDFMLDERDADRLLQVRSTSVLWHKERLLNLGFEHLPDVCDKVVWLDADLLFEDDGWLEETCELLERFPVVQPFSELLRHRKSIHRGPPSRMENRAVASMASVYVGPGHGRGRRCPGGAWAGCRRTFEGIGFYDRSIVGSGDLLTSESFWGQSCSLAPYLSPAMVRELGDWQGRLFRCIGGRVSCGSGRAHHLWHGSTSEKHHIRRLSWLALHDFDPERDIRLNQDGCWEWGSDKPQLHRLIENYLVQRDLAFPGAEGTMVSDPSDRDSKTGLSGALSAALFSFSALAAGQLLARRSPRVYRLGCALHSLIFRAIACRASQAGHGSLQPPAHKAWTSGS